MERPLSGIRVTGFEQYVAGPYCTLLMADAGAEVIKIERPGVGDPRRTIPPTIEKNGIKKNAGFMSYNRNKKSVAVDLRQPEGQEIVRRLVLASDVVVENLKPGSMDRMGLGYSDMKPLNEKLVWAVISGYGRMPGFMGPYSDRPAFDIVAEAMSGVMHLVGYADKPPSWTIYAMADMCAGSAAFGGIMQALFLRERTGKGQMVDSAMLDAMLSLNERMVAEYTVGGQSNVRGRPTNIYPRGAYKTKDGYVALNVPDNFIFGRLAKTMGREDLIEDARFSSGTLRSKNADALDVIFEGWLANLTRDEAVDTLNAAGVPMAPVYAVEDIMADPHIKARGMLMTIDDPDVGEYQFMRSSPRLETNPDLPCVPAPNLGQHTRPVLEELLGYSSGEVDALIDTKVVQSTE
jgi:CoA:oxalate CoA-transferase